MRAFLIGDLVSVQFTRRIGKRTRPVLPLVPAIAGEVGAAVDDHVG
jgi:hypothetical protein